MEIALEYPKNLKIGFYVRYLCAPTCCYQLNFPTAERISKAIVFKRVIELIIGNCFGLYLLQ
jgi:hypothetical protein